MNSKATFEACSPEEEWVNIVTHGIGIVAGIIAIIMLSSLGLANNNLLLLGTLLLYGCTLLWTFTTSTLYHAAYGVGDKLRNRLHLLDHTAIYLFIAGTYTPIALFVLPGWWSIFILASVWTIALLGITAKIFFIGRFKKLSLLLYLLMGWLIVIAAKPLLLHASEDLLFWLMAGGASYTIGTIFFSWRQLKYNHGIWHLFVLGGSICHFWAIYHHLPL